MRLIDPTQAARHTMPKYMSWASSEAIVNLARQIAANKASTLLSHGMRPNHFFFFFFFFLRLCSNAHW
jgi:hypothetical protein